MPYQIFSTANPQNPRTLWLNALDALRSLRRLAIVNGILLMVLPQLGLLLWGAYSSQQNVETIVEIGASRDVDHLALLAYVVPWVFNQGGLWLAAITLHLVAYFGMIHATKLYFEAKPPPNIWRNVAVAARTTVPRGLVGCGLMVALIFISSVIFPPVSLFLIPGCMLPVLMVCKKPGIFTNIWDAIFVRYLPRQPEHRWFAFFQTLSLGALFYAVALLVNFGLHFLLDADHIIPIPRNIFITPFPQMPFGWAYFVVHIVKICALSAIGIVFAVFTTSAWYWFKALKNPLSGRGIAA